MTYNINTKNKINDIIFNNYKHLTDKSKKNMENLVSIINQIDQNKSLAKDDREEQIYNKKLFINTAV
jgi:hypothetical protein